MAAPRFENIRKMLKEVEPPSPAPVASGGSLLDFARNNNFRVTSGFSKGGHNTGSKHYTGSADAPGAIDIDHRGVDKSRLMALAQQGGYRVLDETTRPQGQAVWGGPHYHIELAKALNNPPPSTPALAGNVSPGGRVVEFTPPATPEPVTASLPLMTDASGQLVANPAYGNPIPASVQIPQIKRAQPRVSAPKKESDRFKGIRSILDELNQPQPEPEPAPIELSGLDRFKSGFGNAIGGFTDDEAAQQATGFLGGAGTVGGSLSFILGSGLGGAALGSIIPGAGTAGGGLGGIVAGGTGLGALQEAQRERMAGEDYNALKIAGAGAIGGASSIPFGGAGATLAGTVAKNAAIDAGINTAGDIGLQLLEQGTIDPRKIDIGRAGVAAGIGAAGGGLAGFAHAKLKGIAPAIADKLDQGAQLTEMEVRQVAKVLTQEESQALEQAFRERTQNPDVEIIRPFDEQTALQDTGLKQPQVEITESGINIAKEGAQADPRKPIEIVGDPSKKAPQVELELPESYQRPQVEQSRKASIKEAVTAIFDSDTDSVYDGVSGSGAEMGALEVLNEFGYNPRRITKQRAGSKAGAEYSVKIGGETIRFKQDDSINKVLNSDSLTDRILKNPEYEQNLVDLAKQLNTQDERLNRFIESRGRAGEAVRDAELDSLYQTQEQQATRFKQQLDQAESIDNLDELISQKLPEFKDSPAYTELLDYAFEVENRIKSGRPRVDIDVPKARPELQGGAKQADIDLTRPVDLVDEQGRLINRPVDVDTPRILDQSGKPVDTIGPKVELDLPEGYRRPADTPELSGRADTPETVYKTPEGGDVFTHGRDIEQIQAQLQGLEGQIAAIADIERYVATEAPDLQNTLRNVIDSARRGEVSQFSYIAREAPTEAPRARDNFLPTHFTYETIKPGTQRTFLRKKYGSDPAVVSHLKEEITQAGGTVNVADLQTKTGKGRTTASQINTLINQLDSLKGGRYLKSPRIHGLNIGESTRTGKVDRGIRLDTITESSVTGRQVTPEMLEGVQSAGGYSNEVQKVFNAVEELAARPDAPKGAKALAQKLASGKLTKRSRADIRKMLETDSSLVAELCKVL